jgi:hypothetical protein
VLAGFHDYVVIFGFHDERVANLDSQLRPYTLRYGDLIFACHFHRFSQFASPLKSSTYVVLKTFWKDVPNINLASKLDLHSRGRGFKSPPVHCNRLFNKAQSSMIDSTETTRNNSFGLEGSFMMVHQIINTIRHSLKLNEHPHIVESR